MSFELAWKLSEQIVTLSTLVLGFTATFAKEFKSEKKGRLPYLSIAWALYLFSILCGLLSFMALTGALTSGHPTMIPSNARAFAGAQIISFGAASILVVIEGLRVYRD